MFGRQNNLFVLVAYSFVLLLLLVSARLAFVYYGSNRPPATSESELAREPRVAASKVTRAPIHYDYAAVAAANERLALLQANLERTTAQLHEKSKLLNQRNAECQLLEKKLDESVAFAIELLAQEPSADRDEQTRDVKALLEKDLTALRKQLLDSEVMSDEHTKRLKSLRSELMEADQQIASLRERAEREIAALVDERLAVEVVTADIMLQLGEDGVPSLVGLLGHEQAAVRLWAATVLGNLGLAATTAIEPLNQLSNDPDVRVVAAARQSLMRIEP